MPTKQVSLLYTDTPSVVDPHHIDTDPDEEPGSTYHPDADPDANSDFYYLI
jgi:hypothetical protein